MRFRAGAFGSVNVVSLGVPVFVALTVYGVSVIVAGQDVAWVLFACAGSVGMAVVVP